MTTVTFKDAERYYWKLEYCPTDHYVNLDGYKDPQYRFTFSRSSDESTWQEVYSSQTVFCEGYNVQVKDFLLLLQTYIAGVSMGWVVDNVT
jgi:hypothetical protein